MLKDYITLKGLRNCPVCGGKAFLRKNASKRFEVYCPKCHAHSSWLGKVEAVIDWYNKAAIYEETHAK